MRSIRPMVGQVRDVPLRSQQTHNSRELCGALQMSLKFAFTNLVFWLVVFNRLAMTLNSLLNLGSIASANIRFVGFFVFFTRHTVQSISGAGRAHRDPCPCHDLCRSLSLYRSLFLSLCRDPGRPCIGHARVPTCLCLSPCPYLCLCLGHRGVTVQIAAAAAVVWWWWWWPATSSSSNTKSKSSAP